MGGRVSEEVFFGDVSTGAHNDIEQATRIARLMVTQLGMSELGPIRYEGDSNQVFLGRELGHQASHSGQVAYEIDQQVRKIIGDCYDEAKKIIEAHKTQLETIANALLEYETLANEEIEHLFKYGTMPKVSGKTDKEDVQEITHAPEDTLEAAPVEVERPKQPEPVDDPEDDLLDEMKD